MINDGIEVEINLNSIKEKMREDGERRKDKEAKWTSSPNSQEASMDIMMKIMETLIKRLTMDNRSPPIENQAQQNRNQNFRIPLPSQIN